jgi:hypothetical protein
MSFVRWILLFTGVAMNLADSADAATVAPFGSWKSPISAQMLVAKRLNKN